MVTGSILVVGGLAVLVVIGVALWLIGQGRKFKLTETSADQKPDWMRSSPPPETREALKAAGAKMAVFAHEEGERLAAPFAEQIEDLVRARLANDPELAAVKIDFGTGPEGGLEISVDGQPYAGLEAIPNPRLKALLQDVIAAYNQAQ
jgi:hypothetical protein